MPPDAELPPLVELVTRFRQAASVRDRTRLLQQLLGPQASSSSEMHRRALLVTALREAKLWPATE